MDKPTLLIKFGKLEHLQQFLSEGLLHCKSIKWFAEYEDGKLRGDTFEAVVKTIYFEDTVFKIKEANNPKSEWKSLNVKKGLYKEYHENPLGNIFCLSMFEVEEGIFGIDKKCSAFGGHFVLIHNQVEFFLRIKNKLSSINMEFCKGEVEYLDLQSHTGEKKLYQKDKEYSFQHEYRIHLHRDFSDTFEFSIGNIQDIATLFSFEDVRGFLIEDDGEYFKCKPLKDWKEI